MRNKYLLYGECLSIDYINKIIRKRDPAGRHFHVGIFSGQTKNGNIVIFGLSILSSEIFIYHKKAFEMFFDIMDNNIPKQIITPDSRQLFKAL